MNNNRDRDRDDREDLSIHMSSHTMDSEVYLGNGIITSIQYSTADHHGNSMASYPVSIC